MTNNPQQLYRDYLNENISKENFLRQLRNNQSLNSYITPILNFQDTLSILKNKRIITEEVNVDNVNPYEYNKGLKIENEKVNDLEKARNKVLKNLEKDPTYYTNLYAGVKPKKKRNDLWKEFSKKELNDKGNAMENCKDCNDKIKNTPSDLGDKEKAKSKNAKGVEIMKGSTKKEKIIKINELLNEFDEEFDEFEDVTDPYYGNFPHEDDPERYISDFENDGYGEFDDFEYLDDDFEDDEEFDEFEDVTDSSYYTDYTSLNEDFKRMRKLAGIITENK